MTTDRRPKRHFIGTLQKVQKRNLKKRWIWRKTFFVYFWLINKYPQQNCVYLLGALSRTPKQIDCCCWLHFHCLDTKTWAIIVYRFQKNIAIFLLALNNIAIDSSVDSSAPSILPPWVRVPSTPSMLFSIFIFQIVYLSFELECEKNENKQKEAGIGPLLTDSSDLKR